MNVRSRAFRPRAWAVATAAAVTVAVAAWQEGGSLPSMLDTHGRTVVTFVVAIMAGEVARLRMPSKRLAAPLASAAALGLAFLGPVEGKKLFDVDAGFVILVVAMGLALPAVFHRARGVDVGLGQVGARLLAVAVAATLAREWSVGGVTVWSMLAYPKVEPRLAALAMVLVSGTALVVEVVLTSGVRAERQRTPWATALRDELGEVAPLTFAVVTSGPLIALIAPSFGLMSLPAALFPLAITYVAVARYTRTRLTYRETIATLAHLTERGGYTPAGHAERVSHLSVLIGRAIGLPERELRDLEYAALMHDLGQISLGEPIPRGATVLVAPVDQRGIAIEGARIVRQAEGLDAVATYIESQATAYRQVREHGHDVPLVSRIIKVANAFDDLTGGEWDPIRRAAAMERIHLGLGYEYDPQVVEALTGITSDSLTEWVDETPVPPR